MRADIVIIGGGILGSSIAYHPVRAGRAGDVVVIERDPACEDAATTRSNGGIRRLFGRPGNIEMASFGLAFFRGFADTMAVDGGAGDGAGTGSRCKGGLFTSDAASAAQMERSVSLQERMGVEIELHSPGALVTRIPSISTQRADLAVLFDRDAWIDPHGAPTGIRCKARALGVRFVAGEAFRLDTYSRPFRECESMVEDSRRGAEKG